MLRARYWPGSIKAQIRNTVIRGGSFKEFALNAQFLPMPHLSVSSSTTSQRKCKSTIAEYHRQISDFSQLPHITHQEDRRRPLPSAVFGLRTTNVSLPYPPSKSCSCMGASTRPIISRRLKMDAIPTED